MLDLQLNRILRDFKIDAKCVDSKYLQNYTYFDLKLNNNAKVKDIKKYSDEFALGLKLTKPNIRVLPEQGVVRLEFMKASRITLNLLDYIDNHDVPDGLSCVVGETISGDRLWLDLAAAPHLIVSGTTGSGKSVFAHNIIANLFNYHSVELFLIDPKSIEFSDYESVENVHVGYSYEDSIDILDHVTNIMDSRYKLIKEGANVNEMPYVVLIIDEFGDLIMQDQNKEFYTKICRLSQKCRAAKIHIIMSTQRPSVNIISGTIKANFPTRVACKVASATDSKVILDYTGAENLLGKGDSILRTNKELYTRFQIAFTTPKEIVRAFHE